MDVARRARAAHRAEALPRSARRAARHVVEPAGPTAARPAGRGAGRTARAATGADPERLRADRARSLVMIEALPAGPLTVHLVLDEGQWTLRVHGPQPGPLVDRVVVSSGPPDEADVVVRSSAPILLWLRRHDLSYDDALAADLVHVDGDPESVEAFLRMYGIDPGDAD